MEISFKNRWIRDNFGPTIRNSSFKDLKIILHDDIRLTLPFYLPKVRIEGFTC